MPNSSNAKVRPHVKSCTTNSTSTALKGQSTCFQDTESSDDSEDWTLQAYNPTPSVEIPLSSPSSVMAEFERNVLLRSFKAQNIGERNSEDRLELSDVNMTTPSAAPSLTPSSPSTCDNKAAHHMSQLTPESMIDSRPLPEENTVADLKIRLSKVDTELDDKNDTLDKLERRLRDLNDEARSHRMTQKAHQKCLDDLNKEDKILKQKLAAARTLNKANKEKEKQLHTTIDELSASRNDCNERVKDLQTISRRLGRELNVAEKELEVVQDVKDVALRPLARRLRGLPMPQPQMEKNQQIIMDGISLEDSINQREVSADLPDENDEWTYFGGDETTIRDLMMLKSQVDVSIAQSQSGIKTEDKLGINANNASDYPQVKQEKNIQDSASTTDVQDDQDGGFEDCTAATLTLHLEEVARRQRIIDRIYRCLNGTASRKRSIDDNAEGMLREKEDIKRRATKHIKRMNDED